jgi:hypothetical protein
MKRTLVERVARKIHAHDDYYYPSVREFAKAIIAMVRRHDAGKAGKR